MHTSHKLTHFLFLFIFLLGAMMSAAAQVGEAYVSDQQPGWMVVYPYYTSNSSNVKEDTFITITNISTTRTVAVHLLYGWQELRPGRYVLCSHAKCIARL
ncbi:MAG: hypothetical protein U0Y68_01710 [Blastocatellia bacterium]